jgi:hypothetical protein
MILVSVDFFIFSNTDCFSDLKKQGIFEAIRHSEYFAFALQ